MDPYELLRKASLGNFFSPGSYDVGKVFRNYASEHPYAAQDTLDSNTETLTNALDRVQFYGEDRAHHLLSKQGLESLPYRSMFVPFGFENKEYFWNPNGGAAAAAIKTDEYGGGERTAIPGGILTDTLIHEGRHPLINQNRREEELTNRKYDYYDALQNKDPERIKTTVNYILHTYGPKALEGLFSEYGGIPASF